MAHEGSGKMNTDQKTPHYDGCIGHLMYDRGDDPTKSKFRPPPLIHIKQAPFKFGRLQCDV